MNTLKIYPDKRLQFVEENSIYITENKIQSFNIILPLTFGDYRTNELECEMRVYLSDDEYMSYEVSTASGKGEVPITNDITENVQTVKIIFFFTKDGNVIGKTNVVEKKIEDAPYLGDPLTPRAEFDEVISEQRQTIQEQSETITQQGETITQQSSQITELNGEVTELSTENTRLENLTETQRETIQHMIDNPPSLEYPENPVIPTRQAQTIRPTPPFYGIGRLEVDGYTPNNQNKTVTPSSTEQTVTAGEGYDGLGVVTVEGADIPLGGIYIKEKNGNNIPIKYLIKDWNDVNGGKFLKFYDDNSRSAIREVVFENCENITTFSTEMFMNSPLEKIILPNSLVDIPHQAFQNTQISEISFPDSLKTVGQSAFFYCLNLVNINLNRVETLGAYAFRQCSSLKNLFLPNSLTTIVCSAGYNTFMDSNNLEAVTMENGFNCAVNLSSSTKYSRDTILSWFNALADRTGETAYTLTIGTTNLNKMTAEEKAIATNKNWNLA